MQGLRCKFQGHIPDERIIESHGRRFARCARCGADLIEQNGSWQTPPRGQRIVWAAVEAGEASGMTDQRAESGDRRTGEDRRKAKGGPLPAFLRGRDRRSGQRDRRTAFGRRFRG